MPAERFFVDAPLTASLHVELDGEEFTHLTRVMRAAVGDAVELINGRHVLATARIETIGKHSAKLIIGQIEERPSLAPFITLAVAIPRFNHLEWIVEKATELGASALILFPGDKSEKTTISEQQLLRMRNLMIAAIKQCGRLDLPTLEILPALSSWEYPPEGAVYFGDTSPAAPLLAGHLPTTPSPITFFTGPEKGFSAQEALLLRNAFKALPVSLHPFTLRAETAPILAIGILRHLLS